MRKPEFVSGDLTRQLIEKDANVNNKKKEALLIQVHSDIINHFKKMGCIDVKVKDSKYELNDTDPFNGKIDMYIFFIDKDGHKEIMTTTNIKDNNIELESQESLNEKINKSVDLLSQPYQEQKSLNVKANFLKGGEVSNKELTYSEIVKDRESQKTAEKNDRLKEGIIINTQNFIYNTLRRLGAIDIKVDVKEALNVVEEKVNGIIYNEISLMDRDGCKTITLNASVENNKIILPTDDEIKKLLLQAEDKLVKRASVVKKNDIIDIDLSQFHVFDNGNSVTLSHQALGELGKMDRKLFIESSNETLENFLKDNVTDYARAYVYDVKFMNSFKKPELPQAVNKQASINEQSIEKIQKGDKVEIQEGLEKGVKFIVEDIDAEGNLVGTIEGLKVNVHSSRVTKTSSLEQSKEEDLTMKYKAHDSFRMHVDNEEKKANLKKDDLKNTVENLILAKLQNDMKKEAVKIEGSEVNLDYTVEGFTGNIEVMAMHFENNDYRKIKATVNVIKNTIGEIKIVNIEETGPREKTYQNIQANTMDKLNKIDAEEKLKEEGFKPEEKKEEIKKEAFGTNTLPFAPTQSIKLNINKANLPSTLKVGDTIDIGGELFEIVAEDHEKLSAQGTGSFWTLMMVDKGKVDYKVVEW